MKQLQAVAKKYGEDRRTEIVLLEQLAEEAPETEEIPATTPCHLFLSKEGYFKKISPQSLRMSGEQKYKEGDGPAFQLGDHQRPPSCSSSPTGSSATRPSPTRL